MRLIPKFTCILFILMSSGMTQASEVTEYWALVQVKPTKPDGKAWDASGGAPDITLLVEGVHYLSRNCRETYKCEIRFTSKLTEWYFEIYDKDMLNNDLIGNGVCKQEETCELAQAEVVVKPHPMGKN